MFERSSGDFIKKRFQKEKDLKSFFIFSSKYLLKIFVTRYLEELFKKLSLNEDLLKIYRRKELGRFSSKT